jgi:DNA-binding NtrC family response regulator
MAKLLVIDDEASIRFSIEQVFADKSTEVLGAETASDGLRLAAEESPDVILLDIRLGGRSGLEVFDELHRLDPRRPIIFITGHGTTDTAIEAMKLGAYDYLVKPLDASYLQHVVNQACAISHLMHVPTILEEGDHPEGKPDRLIGSGAAMQTVCKQIGRVAPQDVNVLIIGESGAGKELVARAIYYHSRRNQGPFLTVDCATTPEPLLESELFGHERGAFPGADHRRIGKFEQARGGMLLLDEIGDMAPGAQTKLLRLLQEGAFERLGGSELISADVRIIATTKRDLDALIAAGMFRHDLYYRLRGVTINLPPLRDRREDIAELAHYFLFRFNRQLGTIVQSIAPEALELLEKHSWPGNLRELQSVIREALIVSAGPAVLPEFLPANLHQGEPADIEVDSERGSMPDLAWDSLREFVEAAVANDETDIYRRAIEQFDRLIISYVMRSAGGQQNRAAETLGLSRVTLRAKLRHMQMSIEKVLTHQGQDKEEK